MKAEDTVKTLKRLARRGKLNQSEYVEAALLDRFRKDGIT
jgi:Ribbon-helix-helix protein, copG family